jgi:hypothetical protein
MADLWHADQANKFQIPSTKYQTNSKYQAPNSKQTQKTTNDHQWPPMIINGHQ